MANLERLPGGAWLNFHETVPRTLTDRWTIVGDPAASGPAEHFYATAICLYPLVAEAISGAQMLTTTGTTWSFSKLLDGTGALLDTDKDQAIFDVEASMLATTASTAAESLVLASGGTKIAQLNQYLENGTPARSLRTSGSFDGQSVAGMLGTGVHGSALHCGPFQNHVRGIHIITGDARSVWVEAGPQPLFDPDFVRRFATDVIVDRDIFEAALVHLGGLGIVNAVALEVRDSLRLDIVRMVRALDVAHIALLAAGKYLEFAQSVGQMRAPYYVELTFNPFSPFYDGPLNPGSGVAITMYFETRDAAQPAAPIYAKPSDPLHDLLEAVETYIGERILSNADLLPPPALAIAYLAVARYEAMTKPVEHGRTWGEANGAFHPRKIGNTVIELRNDAFAVPRGHLLKALRAVRDAFPILGGGHLVATVRFVSESSGTLAFTRFDDSAVINLDGLITRASARAVADTLANFNAAGIEFSQHWGKMGIITPARLVHEFGDPAVPTSALARWKAARDHLLSPEARAVFCNTALISWGLA